MKKIILLSVCLLLVLSGMALAGVIASKHNIASGGCVSCHTPHGAIAGSGPLWNRNQVAPTYTPYASATFEMGPVAITAPQSLACLTCHNGVASTIVNAPGPGTSSPTAWDLAAGAIGTTNPFANIGSDLRDDHPIGFTYTPASDLQGNSFPAAVGNLIAGTMPLFAGKVECATCHDVHNVAYPTPTATEVYFLRQTNVNSAMCVACHVGK